MALIVVSNLYLKIDQLKMFTQVKSYGHSNTWNTAVELIYFSRRQKSAGWDNTWNIGELPPGIVLDWSGEQTQDAGVSISFLDINYLLWCVEYFNA